MTWFLVRYHHLQCPPRDVQVEQGQLEVSSWMSPNLGRTPIDAQPTFVVFLVVAVCAPPGGRHGHQPVFTT